LVGDSNGTEMPGEDMLKAIAKADHRLYTLLYQGTQFGSAVGGIGFDLNGQNTNALIKSGNTVYPLYPVNGFVNTTAYDFDNYNYGCRNDHWQSGWTVNGYWSYWVKILPMQILDILVWELLPVLKMVRDVWNFNVGFNETLFLQRLRRFHHVSLQIYQRIFYSE
jgi:hypothetical protein